LEDEAANLGKTLALAAVSEQTFVDMNDLLRCRPGRFTGRQQRSATDLTIMCPGCCDEV
jgi:hypothetical protein